MSVSHMPVGAQEKAPQVLKTFESDDDLRDLEAIQGTMRVEDGALHLDLAPSDGWPQLRMIPASPLDWSGRSIALRIKNAGDKPVQVGLRIDDDPAADGWRHSWTGTATLAPGEGQRLLLDPGAEPMSFGMRALPPVADSNGAVRLKGEGEKLINAKKITSWQLFVPKPRDPVNLVIEEISLLPGEEAELNGLIDRYGQSTRSRWPGKITSDGQLKVQGEAEISPPANNGNLDKYGGWAKGPKLRATGFFRTERVNGKWWLVDPLGHLFFSSGVAVVQPENPTMITGREAMFEEVPEHGSEMGQFRQDSGTVLRGPVKGGLAYDFGRANLYRKYGPEWPAKWDRATLTRLRSWGFNTLGNWSSNSLKTNAQRLPYVATAGIYGNHARLSDGEDYWGTMHDPFDPAFATNVARSLAEIREKVGDDPYCIGYFVENELGFGNGKSPSPKAYFGLAYGALRAPAGQPAKKALIAMVHDKYKGIGNLNKAWGTKFQSWTALEAPYEAPDAPNDAMKADFSAFVEALANKYFSTVRAQLKKLAPHHLYLGARFSGRPPLEVASASAKNSDVVSFNIYAPTIDATEWRFLNDLKKPVIIGEFHIGATDRGVWAPGLIAAKTQAERAQMFKRYVGNVLDNPNFVGCHWFQWADQPATGRPLDGENYNIGFVDIADTPYPEMTKAAKEINASIYTRRYGKAK